MKASPLFRSLLLMLTSAAFAQELPKRDGRPDADLEPKLMLTDVPDIPLPDGVLEASRPPADVAKLEADLARAKKTAAWQARLCKSGVLSKVESEQSALKVVRLARDLANARLQGATRDAEGKRQHPAADGLSKEVLTEAETALAAATTAAQEATQKWEEAQRAAAELRVQRERKLLALGAGSRSAVKRAEAALQGLVTPASP